MNNKVSCWKKDVFSRCSKPFRKRESHEVQEYGNRCCHVQKKVLFTGISKIAKSKRCRRIAIKLFVFSLCTSGFLYQTWTFLQMYLAYPTTLDISEEYPDLFMAPAMTICHSNRLWRQRYCKAYPENCRWEHTTWESFCAKYRRMCPEPKPLDFNFGIPIVSYLREDDKDDAMLHAAGPDEESNIPIIRISGNRNWSFSNIILKIPKYGFHYRCFSIFSLLLSPSKEPYNMTLADGYHMWFFMHPEEYFDTVELVQASIVLHDPRKAVNPMTEGITLTAGKMYRLFLTMERTERLPPPYGSNCRDYLTEWKKNGGLGPLSKDDCISQCKTKINVYNFGCVGQSMMYADPNIYPICESPGFETSSKHHRICTDLCQDACEENIYHLTAETIYDINGACKPTDEYCKSQYMALHVSFNRMKIKKFKQIPRIESIELFSYIGGYLGMWLGISLAAVYDLAEMIYDVIQYAFLRLKNKKKRKSPTE